MHGFLDVIVGTLLGALISIVECTLGDTFDQHLHSSGWKMPVVVALSIIALVRVHPEPADDCPCFDDSVAFAGVYIGCEVGNWHFAQSGWAWDHPVPATVPFDFYQMSWLKIILRILLGVFTIFAWRELMKPMLLRGLPPIFRIIERLGLNLPRKFFVQAS
jgi:hypothetical protein